MNIQSCVFRKWGSPARILVFPVFFLSLFYSLHAETWNHALLYTILTYGHIQAILWVRPNSWLTASVLFLWGQSNCIPMQNLQENLASHANFSRLMQNSLENMAFSCKNSLALKWYTRITSVMAPLRKNTIQQPLEISITVIYVSSIVSLLLEKDPSSSNGLCLCQ